MQIVDKPLKKDRALRLFKDLESGTEREAALAEKLGLHRTSVHRWGEYVPRPYAIILMNLLYRAEFGLPPIGE